LVLIGPLPRFHAPFWLSRNLVYFTYVLAYAYCPSQDISIINKQGYGLARKGSGNAVYHHYDRHSFQVLKQILHIQYDRNQFKEFTILCFSTVASNKVRNPSLKWVACAVRKRNFDEEWRRWLSIFLV